MKKHSFNTSPVGARGHLFGSEYGLDQKLRNYFRNHLDLCAAPTACFVCFWKPVPFVVMGDILG